MAAQCHDLPACKGCGCRGGPGYRYIDPNPRKSRCVGYRELDKLCGNPPGLPCVYEGLPNTDLNRECIAARVEERAKAKAGKIRARPHSGTVETTD